MPVANRRKSTLTEFWHTTGRPLPNKDTEAALHKLLDLAAAGFGRHLDNFQRHRDAVVRQLGAILAAETIILRFLPTSDVPWWIGTLILTLLAVVSLILAHSGASSCMRAYLAALEHAVLFSKVMWALFPEGGVKVDESTRARSAPPVPADRTLHVPRYLHDALEFETTEKYVAHHLGRDVPFFQRRRNTYYWALIVIWSLGSVSFVVGFVGGIVFGF